VRSLETVLALVILGTVVAAFAKRQSIPAPSLLVVAGLLVGLIPGIPPIRITPDVVSLVVLPPLLYAASEELAWREIRQVWRPVIVLAVGLVFATAAAVAAVAAVVSPLTASMAFVLGAVLASTDPVAVTALGRRLSLPVRIQALVQAESLFNDATSLVLFRIAVSFAVAGAGTGMGTSAGRVWLHGIAEFAALAGGGALAGGIIAAGVILLRGRITDPVLETVVALITPYAAYVLAETLKVSGVTAVIVTGLAVGARRTRITTPQTRLQLHSVYQTVVFLLESVVFSLIGLELPTLVRDIPAGQGWPLAALAIAATLVATRIAWIFPLAAVRQWRQKRRPSWQVPAVVAWAGTRGVVPLAAALSIPLTTDAGSPLPQRDLVLVLATVVIAVSLVVQGLTLGPLVRFAGISRPAADTRHEETVARLRLAEAGLARLEELADTESAPDVVIDRLRRNLQARIGRTRARLGEGGGHDAAAGGGAGAGPDDAGLRRDLIAVENAELNRLYESETISEATRRRLQRALDIEAAWLGDDHR
jgi:monovalent cation/hydrogen antiporter